MPNIRVESRPQADPTTEVVRYGPWPRDILVRGLSFSVSLTTATPDRLGRVGCTLYGNAAPFLEVYPSGNSVIGSDAVGWTILCSAIPGAGVSAIQNLVGATVSLPRWSFSIPYNWIIPQRGTVYIGLDGAQAGDSISVSYLWYEYGLERAALPKPAAPKSSKNNP